MPPSRFCVPDTAHKGLFGLASSSLTGLFSLQDPLSSGPTEKLVRLSDLSSSLLLQDFQPALASF